MNLLLLSGSPNKDGATNKILDIISSALDGKNVNIQKICLSDYHLSFCLGCRKCHTTAKCVQHDNMEKILESFEKADKIVIASPSYWADITAQLKLFIDRCTPYCNTHVPHAKLPEGKKGYAVALRTGQSTGECLHIIDSINHFFGHMEIEKAGSMFFCGINDKADIKKYENEIVDFAMEIGR